MASKNSASVVLFLSVNLMFFALVTAYEFSENTYIPQMHSFPTQTAYGTCRRDAFKFGVCANLLDGFISVEVGTAPYHPCCTIIRGLVDLEAAACLCTAIKVRVLDIIELSVPLTISFLLNACGKRDPTGFECVP
ncbi:pEARLI1-like lipid transfer protein [Thalictrum thalictroides]|uniref:PEARLI1-like lipid transfer protein n=1 Tax=Thalictrum thalictroides TaxID=46969 RepID=A0A7J6X2B6_THATH|nr:pEARLI1-like lipid transfer protein [Thalictrum thalictroides]